MTDDRRNFLITAALAVMSAAASAYAREAPRAVDVATRNRTLDAIRAKAVPEIQAYWLSCRQYALACGDQAATGQIDIAIEAYFIELKALPEKVIDADILAVMKRLYKTLNAVNRSHQNILLQTDERELLVPIFDDAAVACGIDPAKYDGEPGGQYRDF